MLEVILVTDGKVEVITERLCDFENAITPIVGALGVLYVINFEISNNDGLLELSSIVNAAVTHKTMAKIINTINIKNYSNNSELKYQLLTSFSQPRY